MDQIRAFIKYLFSFFKNNWQFEDYPLETWSNLEANQSEIKFGAKFTNWQTLIAHGNSNSEAVENLRKSFNEYSQKNILPRPGSKVSFEFAKSSKIDLYEEIAIDFFDKIIGISYFDCFISDYSTLFDFGLDDEETIEKIKIVYKIEPAPDLILADIFEQISKKTNG